MKEYMVSFIIITSSSIDDDQILKLFSSNDIELSCRVVDSKKVWGLKRNIDNKASVIDQVNFIKSVTDKKALIDLSYLFQDVYLHIGVCYDTFTCTVGLTNDVLKTAFDIYPKINLEIVCYPSTEED